MSIDCLTGDKLHIGTGVTRQASKAMSWECFPQRKKNTHKRVSRKYRASCKYRELFRKEVRRRQENMETRGVSSMAGSGAQQKIVGTRVTKGVRS